MFQNPSVTPSHKVGLARLVSLLTTLFTGYHSLDFSTRGCMQDRVPATLVPRNPALRTHIRDMIAAVTPDMPNRTCVQTRVRTWRCVSRGSHVGLC
jgi:hypothetical protein